MHHKAATALKESSVKKRRRGRTSTPELSSIDTIYVEEPSLATQPSVMTAHHAASAEYYLACETLNMANIHFTDKHRMCICTTLESTAALSLPLALFELQAHVGLSAGCIGHKNPQFKNDFSQIIAENKDKSMFVFMQIDCNQDSMREFLAQLHSSGRKDGDGRTFVLFCSNIIYGGLDENITENITRYLTNETIFPLNAVRTTQDPRNVLVINYPDLTKDDILRSLEREPESALHADVLIGSPQLSGLSDAEITCFFGCSIRVFNKLHEQDPSVRYVLAENTAFHTTCAASDTKERLLICA